MWHRWLETEDSYSGNLQGTREPVYLTSSNYNTEEITMMALADDGPNESEEMEAIIQQRIVELEASDQRENSTVLKDINYHAIVPTVQQEGVIGPRLSVSSDSDKENPVQVSDNSPSKKRKRHVNEILNVDEKKPRLDDTTDTSGYNTFDESFGRPTAASRSFEIMNNQNLIHVTYRVVTPKNDQAESVSNTYPILSSPSFLDIEQVPSEFIHSFLNESDVNVPTNIDTCSEISNSDTFSASIIESTLQTPEVEPAEESSIIETPKVKKNRRKLMLTTRFDHTASTQCDDDQDEDDADSSVRETETPSTSDSGDPKNVVDQNEVAKEVVEPLNDIASAEESSTNELPKQKVKKAPKRKSFKTKKSSRNKSNEENTIKKPQTPKKRVRYICPKCNCGLATRMIYKYHVDKCQPVVQTTEAST